MDQLLQIILAPLAACLILTGIHTYLGLHVVSRGVIFVDLALAQIAALGATFAFLLGFETGSTAGYLYSLFFTFIGAAIFSLSRLKDQRVPQEALIGIVFAVSSAAAILLADQAAQGAEHIEQMLTGSILWVGWPQVGRTLLLYSAIGAFHFIFRRQFLLISMHPEEAVRRGLSIRWWDLLFYLSFGLVITSSVAMAGVLLVFCFLIIPSVIAMLFSSRTGTRLILGWVTGTLVSLGGLLLSFQFDFPSGPAIVCTFGLALALALLLRYTAGAERKGPAVARVGGGICLLLLIITALSSFHPAGNPHSGDAEEDESTRILRALEAVDAPETPPDSVLDLLADSLPLLKEGIQGGRFPVSSHTAERLGQLGKPEAIPVLELMASTVQDPWVRFQANLSRLRLGDQEGIHGLVQLLDQEAPPFLLAQVRDALREISGQEFDYDPMAGADENRPSINRWEVWWHENADRLSWDPESRRFSLSP